MNLKGEPARVEALRIEPVQTRPGRGLLRRRARQRPSAPRALSRRRCCTTPSATSAVGEWYLKNLFGNLHAQQDRELFAPIPVHAARAAHALHHRRPLREARPQLRRQRDGPPGRRRRPLLRARPHLPVLPAAAQPTAGGGYVVDETTAARKTPAEPRPPFPTATGATCRASRRRSTRGAAGCSPPAGQATTTTTAEQARSSASEHRRAGHDDPACASSPS